MREKFQNKYRIPSARWQNWDYGSNGAYFITICTTNREHFFGEIVSGTEAQQMSLSSLGKLAEKYWMEIPDHFPFVKLDEFVVMPNHIHGVLIIEKTDRRDAIHRVSPNPGTPSNEINLVEGDAMNRVSTGGAVSKNSNPMLHQNIPRVVRWYKGRTTSAARKIHIGFAWQSRFHDHIIRDAQSFHTIAQYIINNPQNWESDKFYQK